PDSLALLDALGAVGGRPLHVAAVDHGLRAAAAGEAAAGVAEARARGHGAAVPTVSVDGCSMAAGGRARYDAPGAEARQHRSRLRHDVLPILRRERPDLDRALAELCDRLRADADALDAAADHELGRLRAPDGTLDAAGLDALPDALFVRVVARGSGLPFGAV